MSNYLRVLNMCFYDFLIILNSRLKEKSNTCFVKTIEKGEVQCSNDCKTCISNWIKNDTDWFLK